MSVLIRGHIYYCVIAVFLLLSIQATPAAAQDCRITGIEVRITENCNGNQTVPDWEDDYFVADVVVRFANMPDTGRLQLGGPLLRDTLSIPLNLLAGLDSVLLTGIKFRAVASNSKPPIRLSAWVKGEPGCFFEERNAGVWIDHKGVLHRNIRAPQICSVCMGPPGSTGGRLPSCFPPEVPNPDDPCSDVLNYAPDPQHPEHTPVHYIKMVLHIFQREHPDSIGHHVVHPGDPGNYTREHLPLIRSWFTEADGINGFIQHIPDDPGDGSIHIPDARLRFLNQGIDGVDVFFHPDNKAWGMGYSCGQKATTSYYNQALRKYLLAPDSNLVGSAYYRSLRSEETRNALHVFIAGASWSSDDRDDREPDSTDCIYRCAQGYSLSTQACFDPDNPPVSVVSGSYNAYLSQFDPASECRPDYPGSDAGLGRSLIGEFLHLLSVDHISPFQAHWRHPVGVDGCEDTPLQSELNRMGCALGSRRTVLTQCQIGRMLYQLEHLRPSFERFPAPGGQFISSGNRYVAEPDIIILPGETVEWSSRRELRSNIIVEQGATLRLRCDLGLPADARITVLPGGRLLMEGGRLYRN